MSLGAELISSEWRVFFDGVEVPHQGVSVNFTVDQISRAEIMMEPDKILADIRPQTVVSIWVRERFRAAEAVEPDLQTQLKTQYYLYWEGLTTGVTHSKSPSDRNMRVSCESFLGPLSRVAGFMLGLGVVPASEVITGTFLASVPQDDATQDRDLLQLVADTIGGRETTSMSDVTFSALTTLLAHNGIGRLQERRYQTLSRLHVVENLTLASLLAPMSGSSPFRALATSQALSASSSVLDVLRHINTYVFYRMVQVPAPVPQELPGGFARLDLEQGDEVAANKRFVSTFRRTEFLSLPDMYYTMPPPCNLVFPDMLQSLSVARDFYSEPTRTVLIDGLSNGAGIYMAPSNIFPGPAAASSEVFSYIPQQPDEGSQFRSAYAVELTNAQTGATRRVNSLDILSPYEIEKGMIVQHLQPDVSYTYAQALRIDPTVEQSEFHGSAYDLFLKSVADFRHELARLNRTMQVTLIGHRSLVPGFTCAIFDSDTSYIGYVENCSFMVDPSGRETTQISLSRGRALPKGDISEYVESISETVTAVINANDPDLIKKSINKLRAASRGEKVDAEEIKEASTKMTETQVLLHRALANTLELLELPFPLFTAGITQQTPAELDKFYADTLGCGPLYSGPYGENTTGINSLADVFLGTSRDRGLDDPLAAAIAGPLLTTLHGLKVLDALFEMDPDRDRQDLPPSWQKKNNQATIGVGTFEWQHKLFLKRRRLYMQQYLADHGLELSVRSANAGIRVQGMESRTFAVMVPADRGKRVGRLRFDDTLFCKLPDDEELNKAESSSASSSDQAIAEAQRGLGTLGGLDKELLTTAGRQKFILNYSNKHFGSRAFDGS